MRTFLFPIGRKTWDIWRWMFLLMGGIFSALTVYLAFQLEGTSILLLLILGLFAIFLLGIALVATDEGLQKVVNVMQAF